MKQVLKNGVQAYVTGDMDYHSSIDAVAQGICIIDAGHYGTEYIFMDYMERELTAMLPDLEVEKMPVSYPCKIDVYKRQVKKRGGDFIKIMTTGIMNFDTDGSVTEKPLGFDEVKEMVHIAHEEGFSVMAHTNGARAVREAAVAGADSIEHGNYVDEEAMWAMKENKTVWVPTITVVKNMIGCGRFSDEVLEKIWETGSRNIQRGYEIGVQLALGSDAGAYLVPHGQGIKDEWECFQEILGKNNKEVTEMLLELSLIHI